MNKNIVIYASITVALAVGGFIFFSGTDDYQSQYDSLKNAQDGTNQTQNKATQEDKKSTQDIKIDYQTSTSKTDQKGSQKPQKEKFVESKSVDASGRFEISLINEQAWDENKKAMHKIPVYADIDGNKFILQVPSYLIDKSIESKISIKDKQTGKTNTISAPFIQDLATNSTTNKLEINTNNMENYNFEKVVNNDLPAGPGVSSGSLPPLPPN